MKRAWLFAIAVLFAGCEPPSVGGVIPPMPPSGETAPGTGPNALVDDSVAVVPSVLPSGTGTGAGAGAGVTVAGIPAGRAEPPEASVCGARSNAPILDEQTSVANGGVGLTSRIAQPEERHGGLDKTAVRLPFDRHVMATARAAWPESPLVVPSRLS